MTASGLNETSKILSREIYRTILLQLRITKQLIGRSSKKSLPPPSTPKAQIHGSGLRGLELADEDMDLHYKSADAGAVSRFGYFGT